MKYIRTTMGSIYKVDNSKYGVIEENGIFKKYCENMGHSWYGELVAIKQSDTIEELCDGFIGLTTKDFPNRPDIEPDIYYFNKPFEFQYGENIFKHLKLIDVELKNQNGWCYSTKEWFKSCDIYGFIRTDKGLIYVAKLNDKGELELI